MVKIKIDSILNVNRNNLYETYKNNIDELSKNNPSVNSTKILEYKNDDNKETIKREWDINLDIPKIISKIIPKVIKNSISHYIDESEWNNNLFICNYKIKPIGDNELYTLVGKMTFEENEKNTLIKTELELTILYKNILISEKIIKPIKSTLEETIINQMKENINTTLNIVVKFINSNSSKNI